MGAANNNVMKEDKGGAPDFTAKLSAFAMLAECVTCYVCPPCDACAWAFGGQSVLHGSLRCAAECVLSFILALLTPDHCPPRPKLRDYMDCTRVALAAGHQEQSRTVPTPLILRLQRCTALYPSSYRPTPMPTHYRSTWRPVKKD
eukprot:1159948-Pelagomonas_calceolata.AAC.6